MRYSTVPIFLLLASATSVAVAQSRLGKVDWDDSAIEAARASPLLGAATGFESAAGPLSDSRVPVIAVLPSELHKVFENAGVKLESIGPDAPGSSIDFEKVAPDSIVLDDGATYNIEYGIIDSVKLTMSGTRVIEELPEGLDVPIQEEVSLADIGDEVFESEIQYSRFGEILYSNKMSCDTVDVISYCQSAELLRQATNEARVIFAGVRE